MIRFVNVALIVFGEGFCFEVKNMIAGYSYHIKDEFFERMNDNKLMANKENNHYRPHFYAVQDAKSSNLYWMIPVSSRVDKYKIILENKRKRYGKCNTIVIGTFAGKENAFLIQNAFPVTEEYVDHIHTVGNHPVTVHKRLQKELMTNLKEVLALSKKGIQLIYPDINRIMQVLQSKK